MHSRSSIRSITAMAGAFELDRNVSAVASRNRLSIYVLVGLLMLLATISALAVQRWLVAPILRLSRYAQEIEEGHYDIDVRGSRRTDEVGDLERAFARMSTSVRAHDNEIREIAFTDALTQLPNRRDFRERLDQRLQTHGEDDALALLFIDLDDFKRVNDTLGHETGDRVLVRVARFLMAMSRGEDAVLRVGGDEFLLLLVGEDAGATEAIAQRLRAPAGAGGGQAVFGFGGEAAVSGHQQRRGGGQGRDESPEQQGAQGIRKSGGARHGVRTGNR